MEPAEVARGPGGEPPLRIVITPGLFFPWYYAIHGLVWRQLKSSGTKNGATRQVFLNPFGEATPQGNLSPEGLSAE